MKSITTLNSKTKMNLQTFLESLNPALKKTDVTPAVKPDKNVGIDVTEWFWASMEAIHVPGAPKKTAAPATEQEETPELLIAQNPKMSAATLFNLFKSKGYEVVKKSNEADAASGFAPQQRESKKFKEKGNLVFRARLCEANAVDDGIGHTKFSVILIREGMGNFGTAYYYTKEALQNAVTVFEGKKIYADHPTLEEDQIRPERSVRDILGYFENVRTVEASDGCLEIQGDVKILPDKPYEWARALMRNSVEFAKKFPDKDFVGLSINANGDSVDAPIEEVLKSAPEGAKLKLSKALESGIQTVRVVSKIDDAISCDLVTEAGAGGRILQMLEAEQMSKKEDKKDTKESKEEEKKESVVENKDHKDDGEKDDGASDTAASSDEKQATDEHSDADQDKDLIMSMLKKLGVVGEDEDEEAYHKQAVECMKAAIEGGHSKEDAMQMAAHSMKMSKIMHSKKEAHKESVEESDEEKKESKDDKEDKKDKKDEPKKESEIMKLKGENAKLKESLNKVEVEKHLDKVLRESGFKMEITKAFRKAVGEPKSAKEVDEKFKLFSMGVRESTGGEADDYDFLGLTTEKTAVVREADAGSVDLSDC